jgi:competence protein ComEA
MGDFIRAVDITTGRKVWDYPFSERSGVLATAGGLVFIGGPGGITALDAKTGEELGGVDADVQTVLPPILAGEPMTYMVGGKQYVVLPGKDVVAAYALASAPVRETRNQPKVTTAERASASQNTGAPRVQPLPDAPGKATFVQACGSCHSPENVIGKGYNQEGWSQVVAAMVARGAQLNGDDLTTVVRYLTDNFPPRINVNRASVDALVHRLGVTAEEAQLIVTYRLQNGNFQSMDDLKRVPGVDISKIEASNNRITF